MAKSKKKYYVVWEGNNPGIYDSWADCQLQIKGYPNAKYKSFGNKQEAIEAYRGTAQEHIKVGKMRKTPGTIYGREKSRERIVWESISVDAACSGNPGVTEYQGVHTKDGSRIFYQKFPLGTNNIGEFLAIVHALAMFQKLGKDTPIYSDSKIAMGWVQKGKCKTTLVKNARTAQLYELIERAETWLRNNTYKNPLLKWETKRWGEIPADFGRK